MKKMIAVVVAGLFLMAGAGPAEARGQGGGGRGGGGHSGFRGGHFHGHHFHGHGFRGSVVIGGGYWGPYWGPYWDPYWYPSYYPYSPYGYAPAGYAPATYSAEPQTYIEQSAPSYWYYCEAQKAYYPYVRECPGGWLTVLPQPQGAPAEPKQ